MTILTVEIREGERFLIIRKDGILTDAIQFDELYVHEGVLESREGEL